MRSSPRIARRGPRLAGGSRRRDGRRARARHRSRRPLLAARTSRFPTLPRRSSRSSRSAARSCHPGERWAICRDSEGTPFRPRRPCRSRRGVRLRGLYPWPLNRSTRRIPCAATSTTRVSPALARVPLRDRHLGARTARRCTRSAAGRCISRAARSLAVADGDVDFGYWHIVPAVEHHERRREASSLGHVEAPWLHVHFAEHRAGVYRDPLRPGALSPWATRRRRR